LPPYTTPYETIDAAALAGFKKILSNNVEWKTNEYAFLVIEQSRPIRATIPPHMATITRAFCHTHPTPGTFSSGDLAGFKKLRELTAKHKLRYDIVYYLLESNGQVRRSSNEKDFFQGDLISGLDKAIP
jgi:hypothetical protein